MAASGTFRKDTEVHLELSQTSKAERFAKIAISCKSYFAKRPVLDVWLDSDCVCEIFYSSHINTCWLWDFV